MKITKETRKILGYFCDEYPAILYSDIQSAMRKANKCKDVRVFMRVHGFGAAILAASKVNNKWIRSKMLNSEIDGYAVVSTYITK
jgi:hypothetical protein